MKGQLKDGIIVFLVILVLYLFLAKDTPLSLPSGISLHTNNFIGCWSTVAYGDQLKFQISSDNTFYLVGPGGLITGSWSDFNSTTINVTYSGQTGQSTNDIVNYDTNSKSISMVKLKLLNDAPVKFIKGSC